LKGEDKMFILSIILIVFLFIFVSKGLIIVRQAEVIVVERLGKYHKTLESGLNFIIPIIDTPRVITWRFVEQRGDQTLIYTKGVKRIDLRESVYDFPKQRVITSDNVTIEINALLYFQVTDPMKAVYEIANLPEAIEKLTQTTLRNVIGGLSLDETLVSRDEINTKLRLILDEATDKWGVKVNRVELQDIIPPTEIRVAMEKQMKAERDKRASILTAEGEKRSQVLQAEGHRDAAITKAEGYKRSKILEAEGQAEARLKVIEAEKKALEKIKETVKDEQKAVEYLVALKYIEAFRNISENSNDKTVFMPYEATSVMSSLGGIKELFQKK
jgi:regulator of protease activity HflC (stomatin/prohibitin superfamily)